jgi:nucleotide-binding universal stress UspA family protein
MDEDRGAMEMARRIAANGTAEVTILHVVAPDGARTDGGLVESWDEQSFPDGVRLKLVASDEPLRAAVHEAQDGYDLIVAGVSGAWGTAPTPFGRRHEELARVSGSALLVVRRHDRSAADAGARSRHAVDRDSAAETQAAGVV